MIEQVAKVLKQGKRFLLTTASPDGDSVGSMLGLALALEAQNKEVQVFSPEPFPDNLTFLSGMNFVTYDLPKGMFDALVVMDTGSSKLLWNGDRTVWSKLSSMVIDIDHHPDNDAFGNLNLLMPKAASTGEIIYELLSALKWDITPQMAECLLTALMADTGAFRYPNVTTKTLTFAADLVDKGASNAKIARQLYSTASPTYIKLLGRMLTNLKFDLDEKMCWSVLTQNDFKGERASDDTADKMVEQLDLLGTVKVYALLREMEDGKIKVSLRSRNDFPVNKVAALFGGGGHKQAAGCQLFTSVQEAEEKIVNELKKLFQ